MNHFRPQTSPTPTFEGWYSKFDLPSKGHLALVICSVPKAESWPHMVSLTYVPPSFPGVAVFQRELQVEDIQMINMNNQRPWPWSKPTDSSQDVAFELKIPNIGTMKVYNDSTTEYNLIDPGGSFSFSATIPGNTNRTPWTRSTPTSTPEGLLSNLPLPLHWHVHTLSSKCTFRLSIPNDKYPHLHPSDRSNTISSIIQPPSSQLAYVHQEKNWATSFPSSHIWIQARNQTTNSGINIAGGSIINTESFLLSYHAINPDHDVSFTPPYSMQLSPSLPWPLTLLSNLSPTLTTQISWPNKTVEITISSLTRKIVVKASAPENTFFGISAPFSEGHRKNYLGQSFRANVEVVVYGASRLGLGHWNELCMERFEGASLEFGADWYGAENKGR